MDQDKDDKTVRVDAGVTPKAGSGRPGTPCIVHFSGAVPNATHKLSARKELLIGRAPEADICIPDRHVSQRHARFMVSPEGVVFVQDLGSTNGTYVNVEKVTQRALRDGDEVLLLPDHRFMLIYQANVETEEVETSVAESTSNTQADDSSRQGLIKQIDRELAHARKQNEDLALLMVAIDGFTKLNETHGQEAAAMVLREATSLIGSVLRREDILVRYSNDTFLILLHNLNEEGSVVLAQRIRRTVKHHQYTHAGEAIRVTVSIGMGSLTKKMKNATDMIREVQKYLDKAISAGRDTINGSQSIRAIFRQIGNKHVA